MKRLALLLLGLTLFGTSCSRRGTKQVKPDESVKIVDDIPEEKVEAKSIFIDDEAVGGLELKSGEAKQEESAFSPEMIEKSAAVQKETADANCNELQVVDDEDEEDAAWEARAMDQAQYQFKTIYFDFDEYALRPDQRKALDHDVKAVKDALNAKDGKVVIEGHTDLFGAKQYNLMLSEKRARAVYNYLIEQGVPKGRLSFVGHGSEEPIVLVGNISEQQPNRRAVLGFEAA